mgnify:FL=1
MAKDRIESKYVTVAPGVELHILRQTACLHPRLDFLRRDFQESARVFLL